jgi:hypothetical protein
MALWGSGVRIPSAPPSSFTRRSVFVNWFKKLFQSQTPASQVLNQPPFPPLTRTISPDGKSSQWHSTVHLDSWKGFANEKDLSPDGWCGPDPNPDGELDLSISLVQLTAPEPTEEQVKAFQYLLDHERAVRDAVLQGIFKVYPKWRESFYAAVSTDGGRTFQPATNFPDLLPPDRMPAISRPDDLMKLIRPQEMWILKNSKDGFAKIGFAFLCKWDEEHGLGVVTLKEQVLDIGDATEPYEDEYRNK